MFPLSKSVSLCFVVLGLLAFLTTPSKAGTWVITYSNSGSTSYDIIQPPTSLAHYSSTNPATSSGASVGSASGRVDDNATASVTATLTWQPASGKTMTTDPPPTSPVSILETATASESPGPWSGSGPAPYPAGKADDGLKDPQTASSNGQGYTSTGSHLIQKDGSSGTIPLDAVSMSAMCPQTTFDNTGTPNWEGSSNASVKLTVSVDSRYATISLPGTTPDANGKLHILIGQQCQGTLAAMGFPTGTTITNLQWSAAGNTLQGWTGAPGGSTATILGPANPYTWSQSDPSQPGPAWYWSDTGGAKTVTCTATATPPTGQGSTVSVQGSQTVTLDVPIWSENDTANPTRIDSLYPKVSGPALWAGGNAAQQNGSQWNDSVTIPALYSGHSDWAHLQIITVKGTHGSTPVPNNGVTGLDGSFPYNSGGNDFFDNGVAQPEGDSPGINLLDAYNNYTLNYSFDLYVMYDPPNDTSIWVPLTKLTWTWSPNVTQPPTGWENWPAGTAPGGNPVVPGAGTRCITEPAWTTKISEH